MNVREGVLEVDGFRMRCDSMQRKILEVQRQCDFLLKKLELLEEDFRRIWKGGAGSEEQTVEVGQLCRGRKRRRIILSDDDDHDDGQEGSVGV